MKTVTISLDSDETKEVNWVLAFNDLAIADDKAVFFYLKNEGINDIRLDCIKLSSTQKASSVEVHSALGEPFFTRENRLKPTNKRLAREDELPSIIAYSCSNANDLASLGLVDRLEMREELTTYETQPNVVISPNTVVVLICDTLGTLSGIINITEIITEEE